MVGTSYAAIDRCHVLSQSTHAGITDTFGFGLLGFSFLEIRHRDIRHRRAVAFEILPTRAARFASQF